ncbi:MAG: hypothetical protein HY014_05430 [Acidobacteria bacterium]|nr:hypothetical protein [Acidobacteriota bacterium]MBI3487594.1 hypothetical protein [Acidobacteriota bacterium]
MKTTILACVFSLSALGQEPAPAPAPVTEPAPAPVPVPVLTPAQTRDQALIKLIDGRRSYLPNALEGAALSDGKGDHKLTSIPGNFSHTFAFVTALFYADFPDQHAEFRAAGNTPTIWIRIDTNPKGRVFLVKAKVNERTQNRSVKVGRSGFGSVSSIMVPDSDWTVPFTSKDHGDGLWEITPKAPLKPGEYGIFASAMASGAPTGGGGILYDFGID